MLACCCLLDTLIFPSRIFFIFFFFLTVRPFELGPFGKLLQLLELMSLMAVWLSLWGALVFFSYPRCEAYYGAARNDEDEIADSYKPGQTLLCTLNFLIIFSSLNSQ